MTNPTQSKQLFVREGLENASIRKNRRTDRVGPWSIDLHFKEKSEILQTLCEETLFKLILNLQAIETTAATPWTPQVREPAALSDYIYAGICALSSATSVRSVWFHDVEQTSQAPLGRSTRIATCITLLTTKRGLNP